MRLLQKSTVRVFLLTLSLGLLLALFLSPVKGATLEVTSAADSGSGSLRAALNAANSGDTITFRLSTFPSNTPVAIWLQSALPPLTKNNVTIDASNAGVILDGGQSGAGTSGLTVSADGCTIRGLTIRAFPGSGIVLEPGAAGNTIGGDRSAGAGPNGQGNLIINNGSSGVEIRGPGADNNLLQGNYIGIDGTGLWDAGNGRNGVAIWQGARSNTVGGSSGRRNLIGGNEHSGVWIAGAGTEQNRVIGNYLGTRADGLAPVGNSLNGVAVQGGAANNRVGGTAAGEGNLISGNGNNGVYLSDAGTAGNRVLGNTIGPNRMGTGVIGQGLNGVAIALGATGNRIGDGSVAGRNLISGNSYDGVRIEDADTSGNLVQGNYVGSNIDGTAALANGLHGVDLAEDTHDNLVGGDRLLGQGNLLSGNDNHGLVITHGAHHNTASGNLIGPDAGGSYSLGRQQFGGVDVAEGASNNIIGGLDPGAGNVISGNQTDGIAVFSNGASTASNQILGNRIGLALGSDTPLPNQGDGIANVSGAAGTRIEGNTLAYNEGNGVWVATCTGNRIRQNSIYGNELAGIKSACPAAPQLSADSTTALSGVTAPNARVEFFSDDEDEGRSYEGFTTADGAGHFSFSRPGGFAGPNVTATSTDGSGNSSAFSQPVHLSWTLLLYLNGDNNLDGAMFDTLNNLVAAGASPRANVLVLVDGYTRTVPAENVYSGTRLYDITYGEARQIATTMGGSTVPGELNLGEGDTLVDFVTWGRAAYPAEHSMLAIVDHGGGWAPSTAELIPDALAYRRTAWLAGNSGLSWDFSSDHDYLASEEIRQALNAATLGGSEPLDVLFFDVCLMGMIEVAYQIQPYASYFVSSQNIGWAPVGAQGRYVRTVQGIAPATTARAMAELLVTSYADSLPPNGHPYTVSAVDLAALPATANAVDQLGAALAQEMSSAQQAALLAQVYGQTQKVDYDSDFFVEAATDGFVDLYDFAQGVTGVFDNPGVVAAADGVLSSLETAVVAEQHQSGAPWVAPDRVWDLSGTHGLSIFLPLGEDFELVISATSAITPGLTLTRNVSLRELYSGGQLQFAADTEWPAAIEAYYDVVGAGIPTETGDGPVAGLLPPDVTPPETSISVAGEPLVGQAIEVSWQAADLQTGVKGARLWYKRPGADWVDSGLAQSGTAGVFSFALPGACSTGVAVRASDRAGNVEAVGRAANTVFLDVPYCSNLPVIFR